MKIKPSFLAIEKQPEMRLTFTELLVEKSKLLATDNVF